MDVCVASTNPEKVSAVRLAFAPHYPAVSVHPVEFPSPVSPQPIGDAETRRGAALRARRALEHHDATFGVGIEGGVDLGASGGPVVISWCGIAHRDGRLSCTSGQPVPLPPVLIEPLEAGLELREAMSLLPGRRRLGAHGLVGIVTDGVLTRRALTQVLIAVALAPFLHPRWFPGLSDEIPRGEDADQ